jgi:geranylgeranyl diphosphate synthase type I
MNKQLSDRAFLILERCGKTIAPALHGAVEQLQDRHLRSFVEYHLGWRDASGAAVTGRTGKGLRGALALLGSEAVGGSAETALPGAVAVELIHNFSLLHDDIIDGDRDRRGRETVWSLQGVGWGILTGDALLALAVQQLCWPTQADAAGCVADLLAATAEMIHGQAEDMTFEQRDDVTLVECLAMARRKSGALLGCAASVGARLGQARHEQVEGLAAFGQDLGMVFQATDDLLGIWGDPLITGKPTGSDIVSHKKSIPIVAALTSHSPSAEALQVALKKGDGEVDVARAVELLEESGARALTTELIEAHLQSATSRLDGLDLEPAASDDLRTLMKFASSRDS